MAHLCGISPYMPSKKLPVLLAALLCQAGSGLAQTAAPPPPTPPARPVAVNVPVPRAMILLSDCAQVLLSRDDTGKGKIQTLLDRRRARSARREEGVTVTLPNNIITRTLGLAE